MFVQSPVSINFPMKTSYRVIEVPSICKTTSFFEAQFKPWWFPFWWFSCYDSLSFTRKDAELLCELHSNGVREEYEYDKSYDKSYGKSYGKSYEK